MAFKKGIGFRCLEGREKIILAGPLTSAEARTKACMCLPDLAAQAITRTKVPRFIEKN